MSKKSRIKKTQKHEQKQERNDYIGANKKAGKFHKNDKRGK